MPLIELKDQAGNIALVNDVRGPEEERDYQLLRSKGYEPKAAQAEVPKVSRSAKADPAKSEG
jgi:hypothetical protein